MYPMFGWTDSYPHSRNQMGYAPYRAASLASVAPHMKMDSARPLAVFEPWPYGSSYGYSYPTECHGCCNHNYFPSQYSLKPPFPHFPVLSPHHCHGSYSAFPGNYPVIPVHQIPPPHYYAEQPRYEYDKCHPAAHHCCGCPSHSFRREPEKNVNIEEQEPDTVKKSSEPVVPSQLKSHPYSIVMIPPGPFKNSEGIKSTESARKEENGCHYDSRCDRISKSHDVNPQGSLSEKECQSQQDAQSQFPFPLFWLPYGPDDVGKEDLKGTNLGPQEVKDSNDGKMKISSSVNGSNMENDASQMIAPAKKIEKVEEKKKDLERKAKSIPVKQADDSGLKERVDCIAKKQPSSPKSSKLPPVCLRVDPVLKTKKGKGDSRSPSPPVDKRRLKQSLNEDLESLRQDVQSRNQVGKSKEVDQKKSMDAEEKRVVQTKDHVPVFESSHEVIPLGKSGKECVDGASSKDVVDDRMGNEVILKGQSGNEDDAKKLIRKLSDSEAAAIIQSAYHGYEVRKLETLKKLRQINEISEKVAEVKTRVCAMEACYDIQTEEKQLVAIGETIMSLLLKLDTIQGLHPSIRDVRKSVAKELVSLHEKLDSLIARKSEVSAVVSSPEPVVDHHTANIIDSACVPGNENGEEAVFDNEALGSGEDINLESETKSQDNDSACVPGNQNGAEAVFDNEALGSGEDINLESETKSQDNDTIIKNSVSIPELLQRPELPSQTPEPIPLMDSENKSSKGPPVGGGKSQKVGSEPQIEREDQKHEVSDGHLQMREVLADQECLQEDHSTEYPVVLAIDKTNSAVKDVDSSSKVESIGSNDEAIDLEPSQGALEQMIDDQEYGKTDEAKRDDPIVVEADSASPNEGMKPNALEHADGNKENNENDSEEVQLEPEKMQGEAQEKEVSHTKKQVVPQELQSRTNLDENLRHQINFGSCTSEELPIHDKMVDLLVNSVEATEEVVIEDDLHINSVETSKEEVLVDESVGQTEKGVFLPQATSETPNEDIVGGVEFGTKNARTASNSSVVASQVSARDDTQLMEENARLKEMMEKLIEAGNKQLATISKLSGKVQDLEKKLSRNKKPKTRRFRGKHQDVVLV